MESGLRKLGSMETRPGGLALQKHRRLEREAGGVRRQA